MDRRLISTSKFLSLVLRHRPEVIGVQLDSEGWVAIDRLLEAARQHGKSLTLELLHEVVATNDKQRFALSEDGLQIRASQGHSVAGVDLQLPPVEPLEQLYHGTIPAFLPGIRQQGLLKRSRHHVHLSADEATAVKVARRRGQPIILAIASGAMHAAGHMFYLSANGVWLTESVPISFITFPS